MYSSSQGCNAQTSSLLIAEYWSPTTTAGCSVADENEAPSHAYQCKFYFQNEKNKNIEKMKKMEKMNKIKKLIFMRILI